MIEEETTSEPCSSIHQTTMLFDSFLRVQILKHHENSIRIDTITNLLLVGSLEK